MNELPNMDEAYAIIGVAMDVYNELGPGFLEAVYREAMEIELRRRDIPFVSQPELPVFYKGKQLKNYCVADFLVHDKIVVDVEAIEHLTVFEEAQLAHELKATGLELGLLINFGNGYKLEWKRRVNTR